MSDTQKQHLASAVVSFWFWLSETKGSLYKWLIASVPHPLPGNKDWYSVCPHSGQIDPNMTASITFSINAQQRRTVSSNAAFELATEDKKHSEKFMLRWIEVERGTEIGDWIMKELTVGETYRARWLDAVHQKWGDRVKIHKWRMRAMFEDEEEAMIEQDQGSRKLEKRWMFKCIIGQSIGLYQ